MKKLYFSTRIIISIALFFMSVNSSFAEKYYVSQSGSNSDGLSWINGFADLQDALSVAVDGDTIVVAKGTYIPDAIIKTVAFKMIAGVQVFGGFVGNEDITQEILDNRDFETNETTLSGDLVGNDGSGLNADNSYTVVVFDAWDAAMSNTTILDGFTIRGGNSVGTSQEAGWGGGIYMQQGASKDCNPLLRNLIVKNNRARSGGGLYMDGLLGSNAEISPSLEKVVFDNNYAYYTSGCGGAIYLAAGPNSFVDPEFKEVAFIHNTATASGGAVFFLGGYEGEPGTVSSKFSNVTFYGNSCDSNNGNAIYVHGEDGVADPVFNNVIFYGNAESQIFKYALTGAANPSFNHCLVTGSPSSSWNSDLGIDLGGNIEGDPLLADPENSNIDVVEGSPVLNAGDNAYGLNIGYYQGAGIIKPTVTLTANLIDFGTIQLGNTSAEQTFTVLGSDLVNVVSIHPPAGFEVSLSSGTGFFSDLNLNMMFEGIETPVYIRFKPTVIGEHNGNIAVNSPGASEQLFPVTAYAGGSPELSVIDNQSACVGDYLNVAFTVDDDDVAGVSFEVLSSDETILPIVNTEVTGNAGTYNLNLLPLNAGDVDITIQATDADLNETSAMFTLTSLAGPELTVDFTQRVCYGDPAEINVSATGGTGSVIYSLNDVGYSLQTYYNALADGDYVVVALDDAGCTDTSEVYQVSSPGYITGTADITKQISCRDDNDAIITVEASGGWGDFEYSLNNIDFQTSGEFTDLGPGDYSLFARDIEGCTQNLFNANIINPDYLDIDYITVSDQEGSSNKTINIVAYGGWYPLMYAINDGAYQTESFFTNLSAGDYDAYVKDDNGCTVSETVNVTTTGIDENISETALNIYPNPASDYIYFDAGQLNEKIEGIEIYSFSGQKYMLKNPDDAILGKIDVRHLNRGMYLLILKMEKGSVTYKKTIID